MPRSDQKSSNQVPRPIQPLATEPRKAEELLALDIVAVLRSHGHLAYLVGGCVRDRLLGIRPKDFDVSTDAVPEQVVQYFTRSERIGAHFGVVLVGKQSGPHVEVATFRSDSEYSDGRRPDRVHFETDPKQDVFRRDFTVNGLLEDPVSGEIIDFVGGRRDLAEKKIRAIGDPERRFAEDHLRMLRAVRFAARLQFSIDPETTAAIQRLAPSIRSVAAERVRDELTRILTEGHANVGFELLHKSGLLPYILPEISALQGVQQPPEFHPEGDVWIHTLMMLEGLEQPSSGLAWGVLLHDVGKPPTFRVADRIRFDGHAEVGASMAQQITTRLKFASADSEHVASLVANHMKFKDVRQMRTSTLKRFCRLDRFPEHLELHRLDCLCSHGSLDAYNFVQAKVLGFGEEQLRPARLLTGANLIELGYLPGPSFGRILEAVETAQLEGQISSPEEALAMALDLLGST